MVRLAAYGGLSCAAAAYVVLSAFRQRSNFFAAAVYLSKSNASMMLLWNFGIFLTIIFGRGVQTVFFGPLRLVEVERMHERIWYAITESLLALTIFRESFDTAFVILFVSLLFLKVFHWLASDRVEMMEQAPVIPRLFHMRMVSMLSILWVVDTILIAVAADSILTEGPSVMIMFASEYMILLATLLGTSLKYGANAYDLRTDVPWENKSVFIFYVELACDFLKLATYLCFFSLILTFYGLPLNILRDVYITARSFINKIRDLSRYRQATRNMDQRYPNATAEEMERLSDKTCIICREDMEARTEAQNQARDARQGPNDTPKKLPCGHIFHFHCLRSWLERQQSCPTCRRPVLLNNSTATRQPAVPAPPAPVQAPVPPANRAAQTGTNTAGSAPTGHANGASRPQTPANAHLNIPTTSQSRPIAASPSRRRAGAENPLVAFQLRSASKPPASIVTSSPQPEKTSEKTPPTLASSSVAPVQPMPTFSRSNSETQAGATAPMTAAGASGSEASNQLDAQRRERIEAALRRLGATQPDASVSTSKPSTSDSQPSKALTPTPTIKIEQANVQVPAAPSTVAGQSSSTVPLAEATRASATPASLQGVLSQTITPLDSRSSSPITILNPMGAFGGRSLPPSSFSTNASLANASTPLTPAPLAGTSDHTSAGQSLPSLSSNEMPRLIPLFDPSDPNKPGYLARFLPSLMQSGFWPAASQSSDQSHSQEAEMVQLPAELDDGQLASLAEVTREGLETRLKLLNSTQSTLQACIGQLQKAMKILDTGDIQGVLQTVSEISSNAKEEVEQTTPGASDAGIHDKGKAKETSPNLSEIQSQPIE